MKRNTGLTLVEILVCFVILTIGLTAISMMVYKGARISNTAVDQNAAAMLIPEAIKEIEKRHLISAKMTVDPNVSLTPPPEDVGLFIETLYSHGETPNMHEMPYRKVQSGNVLLDQALIAPYIDFSDIPAASRPTNVIHTAMWPMPPAENARVYGNSSAAPQRSEKYKAEMVKAGKADELEKEYDSFYRVLYRLERHPAWHRHEINVTTGEPTYQPEDPFSPFAGIYVLTLTAYRDKTGNGKKLEQIAAPVVVYLRDRKAR